MERLQKFLATAGVCSRRAGERLIEEGRVQVNGRVIREQGTRVDPVQDTVRVDGKTVGARPARPVYIVLNKPREYVTTLSDPERRRTIADLVRDVPVRVFPVGRLDYHSEGLLILTNDGALARDLMHPGKGVPKTYAVKVRGQPESESLRRMARGIRLDGRKTSAAQVRLVKPGANSWLEITVIEGRKHLVRRMCDAVGHPVVKLRRTRYDGIRLGKLASGSWRHLGPRELERLREAPRGASREAPKGRSRARPRSS